MEPLKIGNITLPHRAVFGPMAGFTDAPCRRLMAQHGAGFTVSEMVSSRALVYGDHKREERHLQRAHHVQDQRAREDVT